jgi:peptide-methionine (S)-S-oxide reductase
MLAKLLKMLPVLALAACTADAAVVSLPDPATDAPLAKGKTTETAVLAAGCFWGVEGVYEHVKGVTNVVSGYSGGTPQNPTYEQVSSGSTGHAESVRITYDPSVISYGQILKIFFSVVHDPTQLNRQGPDVGTQYRSAIFYANDEQKRIAQAYLSQLQAAKVFPRPIATELAPLRAFYMAEAYHQDFMARNPSYPYIVVHDKPKVEALQKQFPERYVSR